MDMIPQDEMPRKLCIGPCAQLLPATTEFFSPHKGFKDGLNALCKTCRNKKQRDAYNSRPEIRERDRVRHKAYNSRPEGKAQLSAYRKVRRSRPEVKEHERKYRKAYISNPEKQAHRREYQRAYMGRPEVQEYWSNYYAVYYSRPEIKAKWTVHAHNRRARKKAIPGKHTVQDIQSQHERQNGACYYCGKKVGKIYQVDHIIPITREGSTNDPSNLVIACPHCNKSKGNKFLHEWIKGGRLL